MRITFCDSDLHLCIICSQNRLYDIGAECRVVILSKKTISIDKELSGKAPGPPSAISYANEKYQEANGVMYHERLCQAYA
jgi:hypothetical protein